MQEIKELSLAIANLQQRIAHLEKSQSKPQYPDWVTDCCHLPNNGSSGCGGFDRCIVSVSGV